MEFVDSCAFTTSLLNSPFFNLFQAYNDQIQIEQYSRSCGTKGRSPDGLQQPHLSSREVNIH